MRVCFAIEQYPPFFSGHGIQTQRTLPFLRARGIDPVVLCDRIDGPVPPAAADGSAVHRLLDPGAGRLASIRTFWRFRRHIREHRRDYDLVHSAIVGWEFFLNIPYFRSLGMPLVVEMVLLDGDDPLTLSRERLGSIKLGLLRQVDAWIGIARAFLPRLRAVGLPEDRFHLIYTGVDVEAYRPAHGDRKRALRAALGLPAEARVAACVGSVFERKGIDRLVGAWARMAPVPGRDLLLIIGPATREEGLRDCDLPYAEGIRKAATKPGVAGTVRLTGRVGNVEDYLAAADLFVFLSRQEGLGTVILEAQACGLPCVVSPLDGIAEEIVTEGSTGAIVRDPDDPAAVGAAIAGLLSDPVLCLAMGEEARRQAVARFSFETRAAALEAVYRGVLERRRPR